MRRVWVGVRLVGPLVVLWTGAVVLLLVVTTTWATIGAGLAFLAGVLLLARGVACQMPDDIESRPERVRRVMVVVTLVSVLAACGAVVSGEVALVDVHRQESSSTRLVHQVADIESQLLEQSGQSRGARDASSCNDALAIEELLTATPTANSTFLTLIADDLASSPIEADQNLAALLRTQVGKPHPQVTAVVNQFERTRAALRCSSKFVPVAPLPPLPSPVPSTQSTG
jgi:hypothetical protein